MLIFKEFYNFVKRRWFVSSPNFPESLYLSSPCLYSEALTMWMRVSPNEKNILLAQMKWLFWINLQPKEFWVCLIIWMELPKRLLRSPHILEAFPCRNKFICESWDESIFLGIEFRHIWVPKTLSPEIKICLQNSVSYWDFFIVTSANSDANKSHLTLLSNYWAP